MTSIRRFMVVVLLATITLLNFLAALHGYRSSMENSQALFDKQLAGIAKLLIYSGNNIADNFADNQSDNGGSDASAITTVVQHEDDGIAYQIWSDFGVLLQRSSGMPEKTIVPLEEGYSYLNYRGYRWRIYVSHHGLLEQWVVVSQRADVRYALGEEVVLSSVLPIVAELPIIGIFIWLIIGWGLKPLSQLATELQNKDPQDLTPLSESNTPNELTELVESSNGLLYRLRQSFDREKRFSGDAAHELRTPISALKIHLYNLRDVVPKDNESFQMLNISIERMSHLIEQMLVLHRTSPDQFAKNFQKFDLHQVAQQQIIDQYQGFSDKQQTIELVGDKCDVTADMFAIKTLLKNLLDNACKYTPVGGVVKLSVESKSSNAVIMVDDSGEGIPEALYNRVFERFYRVDGDQHKSDVIGCGLGFSIIRHIVDLHMGNISLARSCFDTGLKVTVVLPVEQGERNDT